MEYRNGEMIYVKNPEGKRKVAGTPERPIIDTNSDDIREAVGDERVTVKLTGGLISIVKKAAKTVAAVAALFTSAVSSFFASPAPANEPQVLIACEESGTVRDAFARHGIHAVSCDLQPTRTNPDRHYQGDVRDLLHSQEWDLMIGHPECTGLALSGIRWHSSHWVKSKGVKPNAEGMAFIKAKNGGRGGWAPAREGAWLWTEEEAAEKRAQRDRGLDFFKALWNAPAKRICLEQPMSLVSRIMKKTQTINPFDHGHGVRKVTWLYLKNLPQITPTNKVDGRATDIWNASPGPERAKFRSKTFEGIAEAFASQWAPLLTA